MPPPARERIPPRSIERIVLDSGVKVWTECVPRSPTLAIGVWVSWSSPYEEASYSGAMHLMQRSAFHGTGSRTEKDIALAIESVGGKVSVTTGRDHAGYLAQTTSNKFQDAFELIAELALRPIPTRSTIAAEQKKILEEVLAQEAEPDFAVEALFLRSAWIGRGHCREPKGMVKTFKGSARLHPFKPSTLRRLHRESHRPSAITVTVSGALSHHNVQKAADRIFRCIEEPPAFPATVTATSRRFWATCNRPEFGAIRVMIGVPACGVADSERHSAALLAALLGGEKGSRLERALRPKMLSAEAGDSRLISFARDGVLAARITAEPASASAALKRAVEQMRRLTTDPVTPGELRTALDTCRGHLSCTFRSTVERIQDMARQERYFSAVVDPNHERDRMRAVTPKQIRQLASSWIAPHTLSLAAIGNLGSVRLDPAALRW